MESRSLVIAYALFRKPAAPDATPASNKYLIGMLANIEAIGVLCPAAEVWVYHDDSIGEEWLALLKIAERQSGVKIQLKLFSHPNFRQAEKHGHIGLFGSLLRYISLADFTELVMKSKSPDRVLLIRDADMVMNQQDLESITQFHHQPKKLLHRYADKLHYPWPIIGGSFAIKPTFLAAAGYSAKRWRRRIFSFAQNELVTHQENAFCYFVDQRFLKEIFLELRQRKILSAIDTTVIHIPIAGQKDKMRKQGHYKLWWCHIADEVPECEFKESDDMKKWLCAHSDAVDQWVKKCGKVLLFSKSGTSVEKQNCRDNVFHAEIKPS